MTNITNALGAGSGIDVRAIAERLSAAVKAPREAAITKREAANEARISSLADVASSVSSFSSALATLVRGGSLRKQVSLSDPSLAKVTTVAGSTANLNAFSLEVRQLAKGQTLESAPLASRLSAVGRGTLTLATSAGSAAITIDDSNNSLTGLAGAINQAGLGISASVVTDSSGARLVVKGSAGAANSFTLTAANDAEPQLAQFAFGAGIVSDMNQTVAAQDAIMRIDGVQVTRPSNLVRDLVEGLQFELTAEKPGVIAQATVSRPNEAISQAVGDFVDAFNQVMTKLNAALAAGQGGSSGALRGNTAVTAIRKQFAEITTAKLVGDTGGPQTLAEIGVRTNRDGSLSLDRARLTDMLARFPDAIEGFFNPKQLSSDPRVVIKSSPDRVAPGRYELTDLVAASGGVAASGRIDGIAMTGVGVNLVAPASSRALGLIVGVEAGVNAATITIEPGLSGMLSQIQRSIQAPSGAVASARASFAVEARSIAEDREKLEVQSGKYYSQLLQSFTAMDVRVSSFKATQNYLDQQIRMWSRSND